MTKNSKTPDVEIITSESESPDDLELDGSYFEKLIYFIKVKLLSIISIILVTNSIKSDDTKTKMDLSIKYIITSLLIISVILLISGFFEFIHTINQYKSKHKKEFNWMDWVISFLVGFMYMITCGIVFLYIRYQYTKLK
jgi:hypothetical protein